MPLDVPEIWPYPVVSRLLKQGETRVSLKRRRAIGSSPGP